MRPINGYIFHVLYQNAIFSVIFIFEIAFWHISGYNQFKQKPFILIFTYSGEFYAKLDFFYFSK